MTSIAELTPLTEREFQKQITDLAELYHWEWMHPRAGRTLDSWRTPTSGTMAQGWPDLVLTRSRDRRLIFAEIKIDTGKLTAHQDRVLEVLRSLVWHPSPNYPYPTIDVVVWRPKNWPDIETTLGAKERAA